MSDFAEACLLLRRNDPKLTEVWLSHYDLAEEPAVMALALSLRQNHILKLLDLYGISSSDLDIVAYGVRGHKSLENLYIKSNTGLRNEHLGSLAKALPRTLKALWLTSNKIRGGGARRVADALIPHTHMEELSLIGNAFGVQGAAAMGDLLQFNFIIQKLMLGQCQIDSRGAQEIARGLCVNVGLLELHLNDNCIDDQGAIGIATALSENKTLRKLFLGFNDIGNEGAKALGMALEVNSSLAELDLARNKIGNAGIAVFAERGISRNQHLQTLSLWGNPFDVIGKKSLRDALFLSNVTLKDVFIDGKDSNIRGEIALLLDMNEKGCRHIFSQDDMSAALWSYILKRRNPNYIFLFLQWKPELVRNANR
jgi:Ran GTPase-activating protein (RanGAP) involved in mRNA processing and transport